MLCPWPRPAVDIAARDCHRAASSRPRRPPARARTSISAPTVRHVGELSRSACRARAAVGGGTKKMSRCVGATWGPQRAPARISSRSL